MQHFPIFLAVAGRRIVVSGGGEAALAKLRLLLKTQAHISVFAADPHDDLLRLDTQNKLTLIKRPLEHGDTLCATLFYAANEDDVEDARVAAIANAEGTLVNIVDNLADSQFITPAIVDRDPVTIAIGTEGAAPVLARAIKADLEEKLPQSLGTLARIGKTFRKAVDVLPMGRKRRAFWSDYYFNAGPLALDQQGAQGILPALGTLLDQHITGGFQQGQVDLVGAGPGDADMMTLKARKALDLADVVIFDADVPAPILELARREAIMVEADQNSAQIAIAHAKDRAHVVRLKMGSGSPDTLITECAAAQVACAVIPGLPRPQHSPNAQQQFMAEAS